jgi:hypothetical protein
MRTPSLLGYIRKTFGDNRIELSQQSRMAPENQTQMKNFEITHANDMIICTQFVRQATEFVEKYLVYAECHQRLAHIEQS